MDIPDAPVEGTAKEFYFRMTFANAAGTMLQHRTAESMIMQGERTKDVIQSLAQGMFDSGTLEPGSVLTNITILPAVLVP